MLRLFLTLFVALLMALPASAQFRDELRAAMTSVRAKDWNGAARARWRHQSSHPRHRRMASAAGGRRLCPDQVLAFLERRGDWPGLPYLRKQSEAAFGDVSHEMALSFFVHGPAQTAEGALAQATKCWKQAGEDGAARRRPIVEAWRTMAMNSTTKGRLSGAVRRTC